MSVCAVLSTLLVARPFVTFGVVCILFVIIDKESSGLGVRVFLFFYYSTIVSAERASDVNVCVVCALCD